MVQENTQIMVAPVKHTAAMERREMVKIPAVMGTLGPIEKAVFLASTAKTIAEYDAAELAVELNTALKWISKDIGYRATDESEKQYLVIRVAEILKRYYSALTLKDFRMAFEMSLTGELDDFLPRGRDGQADRNHYQQFNADYVCKILNAYKLRRASVLKRAYAALPEKEPDVDPNLQREWNNGTKRECIAAFDFFKRFGYLPNISPIGEMLYYKILADAGLAPEIVVTIDEQKAIYQRTMQQYARRGMLYDMRRLKDTGPNAPELQHGAYTAARRKALQAAFAKIVADGIDLTDYIKFE